MSGKKTANVTGTGQGIGEGLGEEFLRQGDNVVGTSVYATALLSAPPALFRIDGDTGKRGTAAKAGAPGTVDTALNKDATKEQLRSLQPMGKIGTVEDVVDAVLYLAHADQVTGEVLHVDGGAHAGRW